MFKDTVTIFHKVEEVDTVFWNKAVIRFVHWEDTYQQQQTGEELHTVKTPSVYIPSARGGEIPVYYVPTDEVKHDLDNTVVVDGSQEAFIVSLQDIVIKGEVSDEIPEYDSGNAIVEKYGTNAFRIKRVKDYTNAGTMAHLEVGA